jgi:hypothetical protein
MRIGHIKLDYEPNDVVYTDPTLFQELGVIFDLDVCSPKIKPDWIPAKKHYWSEIDGLKQDWIGNVWCNPPYSAPKLWVEKFIDHKFGIMLAPFAKSNWFNSLWDTCEAVMALDSTYQFRDVNLKRKSIFSPVALFAFGDVNVKALQKLKGRVR